MQGGARQRGDGPAIDADREGAACDGDPAADPRDCPFAACMAELDGRGVARIADQRVGDRQRFGIHGSGTRHAEATPPTRPMSWTVAKGAGATAFRTARDTVGGSGTSASAPAYRSPAVAAASMRAYSAEPIS